MSPPNVDPFEAYFQLADLNRDGRISGVEAIGFFKASNLPKLVLAEIWNYADHNKTGFLGRQEFYNALKLVTVAQSKQELTPEVVKAALLGPAAPKIPAPKINFAVLPNPGLVPSNQEVPNAFPVIAGKAIPGQAQPPWPKMTRADVQKYSRVFFQVDTDRDGKITGLQARDLFLSWRLPREILKQVWDLSDQDNDSMLNLREFCVAIYLMERFREGLPLPSVFLSNTILDETLLPCL
ncbi:membrane traffic protein [Lithospermum erythrorhizon]|uniref:Membrane traffic protein n=1 Tax=Lithospermum erythrorhizon TaxID=34254 RepID=A0AAV3RND8_LITER